MDDDRARMREPVEADERDVDGAARRPTGTVPMRAELGSRHGARRGMERRECCHGGRVRRMLTLALVLALRVARSGSGDHAERARRPRGLTVGSECGTRVFGPWRARVGFAGLSAHEGDGTTPTRHVRDRARLRTRPRSGAASVVPPRWCVATGGRDPWSLTYNPFRHVACGRCLRSAAGCGALADQARIPAVRLHWATSRRCARRGRRSSARRQRACDERLHLVAPRRAPPAAPPVAS